jgi:hypothetical protein
MFHPLSSNFHEKTNLPIHIAGTYCPPQKVVENRIRRFRIETRETSGELNQALGKSDSAIRVTKVRVPTAGKTQGNFTDCQSLTGIP